jgi:rubredoxin
MGGADRPEAEAVPRLFEHAVGQAQRRMTTQHTPERQSRRGRKGETMKAHYRCRVCGAVFELSFGSGIVPPTHAEHACEMKPETAWNPDAMPTPDYGTRGEAVLMAAGERKGNDR